LNQWFRRLQSSFFLVLLISFRIKTGFYLKRDFAIRQNKAKIMPREMRDSMFFVFNQCRPNQYE